MDAARRIGALDGLRGVAVILVVLYHLGLARGGFVGVDIFFVLSGFLITGLVKREHERSGTVSLARFYWARALRLYPALCVAIGFCVLVAAVVGVGFRDTAHDGLISALYIANLVAPQGGLLDHTWTLALEEQFYLVWPALLWWSMRLRGRGRRVWWGPGVAVVVLVLAVDLANGQGGLTHPYVRAMGLPAGCALALAGPATVRTFSRLAYPAGGLLLALAFVPGIPEWLMTSWPISLGALAAVPVVALIATTGVPSLEGVVLTWFGLRSYSLYLWHFPLIALASGHAPSALPHWAALAAGAWASLVAAEISFRWVEQPVLRWRNARSRVTLKHVRANRGNAEGLTDS